jgi:soluble lytic murein transglycosylase
VLILILALLLSACTSTPSNSEKNPASIDAAFLNNPEFLQAQEFDTFLKGKMDPAHLDQVKKSCLKKSDNPFCASYKEASKWQKVIKEVTAPHEPPVITPPQKAEIIWSKGKIKNLRELRKLKVASIIKGLEGFGLEDLRTIGKWTLKNVRCPDPISSAVAARLEDFFPETVKAKELAPLYKKSGLCYPKETVEREQILTRTALLYSLDNQWKDAANVLNKVSPQDAFVGRAIYWRYQAESHLGQTKKAEKTLKELITHFPFSYHAILAAKDQKLSITSSYLKPVEKTGPPDLPPREKNFFAQTETLFKYRFYDSSDLLVDYTLVKFPRLDAKARLYLLSFAKPPLQLLHLPSLLMGNSRLINLDSLSQMYPRPYKEAFLDQKGQIDPYLLYAIGRQESRFDPTVTSVANAQGLLQLIPQTAAKLSSSAVNLYNPETNIELGAKYLNQLSSYWKGNIPLMVASYNAGEDKVLAWTKKYPNQSTVLFLDLIPYRETRGYVAHVLSNYYWYKILYQPENGDPLKEITSLKRKIRIARRP